MCLHLLTWPPQVPQREPHLRTRTWSATVELRRWPWRAAAGCQPCLRPLPPPARADCPGRAPGYGTCPEESPAPAGIQTVRGCYKHNNLQQLTAMSRNPR